jgi:DNA-binding transcriptional LysR family regulator
MDIQDIQIFSRVAAVQNLSAVGAELGLTPGTISKRVQALEDELSVRLFERTTRSIRITEEGARFLTHVETILTELDKAKATVADTAGKPKGKLRVAASQALAHGFVGPAVMQFMTAYPEIEVHIDLTDQQVNLQEAGYDVVIQAGAPVDSALIAKRLAADRQILVASPSYIAANGKPVVVEELVAHACLAFGDTWTWQMMRDGQESSVRFQARLRSDSAEMLRLAALNGQGIMRASELQVLDDVRAGRLVQVLDGYEGAANTGVWALYPSGKHVMPRLRVFLDFLGDWFRSDQRNAPPVVGKTAFVPFGQV